MGVSGIALPGVKVGEDVELIPAPLKIESGCWSMDGSVLCSFIAYALL